MNVRTLNIVTVAVAVLLFGAFIILAEGIGGDDDDDNRLEAIATTTTAATLPRVTTTRPTTTIAPVPSTVVTVAPFITPTTARPTATTRRSTATTRRTATTRPTGTTATTVASGPNGRATEASDNTSSFTHNSDGTSSESNTPVSSNPGPFVFKITTKVLSTSGTTAQVRFTVELTNQRGRRITFPDGLRVSLNVTPSNGAPFVLVMDAHEVTFIDHGETVTVATTAPVEGYGSYDVQGSVEVDYGS